jgi:hypothetical protein
MESRSILVSLSQSQYLRLFKRLPIKRQRCRRARIQKPMRNADRGITGDIRHLEMPSRSRIPARACAGTTPAASAAPNRPNSPAPDKHPPARSLPPASPSSSPAPVAPGDTPPPESTGWHGTYSHGPDLSSVYRVPFESSHRRTRRFYTEARRIGRALRNLHFHQLHTQLLDLRNRRLFQLNGNSETLRARSSGFAITLITIAQSSE